MSLVSQLLKKITKSRGVIIREAYKSIVRRRREYLRKRQGKENTTKVKENKRK